MLRKHHKYLGIYCVFLLDNPIYAARDNMRCPIVCSIKICINSKGTKKKSYWLYFE